MIVGDKEGGRVERWTETKKCSVRINALRHRVIVGDEVGGRAVGEIETEMQYKDCCMETQDNCGR